MKDQSANKKVWHKPAVRVLKIKKDTFSGSVKGNEKAGKRP